MSVMHSLSRGKRASGDLIPWTVSQQVRDTLFYEVGVADWTMLIYFTFLPLHFKFNISIVSKVHDPPPLNPTQIWYL